MLAGHDVDMSCACLCATVCSHRRVGLAAERPAIFVPKAIGDMLLDALAEACPVLIVGALEHRGRAGGRMQQKTSGPSKPTCPPFFAFRVLGPRMGPRERRDRTRTAEVDTTVIIKD